MDKIFRDRVKIRFAEYMREAGVSFEETKPIAGVGMAKGLVCRACVDKASFYMILRFKSDRDYATLSLAWNSKKMPPS